MPQLAGRYRAMYRESSSAPKDYRRWLRERITPLLRRHGLARHDEDPSTGGLRSSALGRGVEAPAFPAAEPAPRPTLF